MTPFVSRLRAVTIGDSVDGLEMLHGDVLIAIILLGS